VARPTRPARSAYLGAPGKALVEIPDEVHAADPVTYINPSTAPFLLLHGTGDVLIAPSQTQRVHKALLAAGVDSTRYLLRGAGHGDMAVSDPVSGLPWSSTTTMAIITDFLHRQLDRR
jgi:dipeptidyl aminopeptidase/acylaminoacyl peptidase